MKPHPRIRKTIKWGGAAVTVLLVVVWVGSGWWWIGRTEYGHFHPVIGNGRITLIYTTYPLNLSHRVPGIYVERLESIWWAWGFEWENYGGIRALRMPLWPFALASSASYALAWRLDTLARRRAKLNLCPKCGYDRTGILQDAKCPECGLASVSV